MCSNHKLLNFKGSRVYWYHCAFKVLSHSHVTPEISLAECSSGKGKAHPRTGHEGPEGELRYRSTLSLTSALNGVGGQHHAPAALPPRKRPVTHCSGGWVGLRAGLDGYGKSRPHRDSIPGPFNPYRVATPTELSRPTCNSGTNLTKNISHLEIILRLSSKM
jgi:hypothetical protein